MKELLVISLFFLANLGTALAQGSLDTVPPVVVESTPHSGSTAVDPNLGQITVTFSKEMLPKSWSWVKIDEKSFPKLTSDPRYLTDKRTCILPVKLQPNRVYQIWINHGKFLNFKDVSGKSAVPYLLSFKTGN